MNKIKAFVFSCMAICLLYMSNTAYAAPQAEYTTLKCSQIANTRPEIVFSTEGSDKRFILLEDTDEGYLILSFDMYGARMFDSDNTEKFDADDNNNIAGWLNSEFIKNGNYYSRRTYKMPEAITRNLVEHDWLTEAGGPHTNFPEDYTTKCALAVPSKTEVMKYFDIFGYADDTSFTSMLLRTSAGTVVQTGGTMLNYITKHVTKAGMVRTCSANKNYGLRPIFYLDKDFFIKERIDITATGDDIRKLIKTKYTIGQLSEIYSAAELGRLLADLPPQAHNVRITGNPIVGETLKCTYDYYAPDGQAEENTKITWVRYSDDSTVGYKIPGAEGAEYTLTAEDADKGVSARVTPSCSNKTGRVTEAVFYRNDILETVDTSEEYIDELQIKGNLIKGGNAYADYKFFHPAYFIEKNTSYEWQGSNDAKSYDKLTESAERQLDISFDFDYKYIRCVVTLENGKQYISEPVELTEGQKLDDASYISFKIRNSEKISCKSGDILTLDAPAFNNASSVAFCINKGAEVIAENCNIYKQEIGDRVYCAVTRQSTNQKMNIQIRVNYDGLLEVQDVTVAVKK